MKVNSIATLVSLALFFPGAQQAQVNGRVQELPLTKRQLQQVTVLQNGSDPAKLVRLGVEHKLYLLVQQPNKGLGNSGLSIYRLTRDQAVLVLNEDALHWRIEKTMHAGMPDFTTVLNLDASVREEKDFRFNGRFYEPVKCATWKTDAVAAPEQRSFSPCPGDSTPMPPIAVHPRR